LLLITTGNTPSVTVYCVTTPISEEKILELDDVDINVYPSTLKLYIVLLSTIGAIIDGFNVDS